MAQKAQDISSAASPAPATAVPRTVAPNAAARRSADDVTALIARITALTASDPRLDAAELARAAHDYDALCHETIRRLTKCGASLTAGNLDAAVEQAEQSPALVDVLRALNFPAASAWTALLARHKRTPPPPFNPRSLKQLEDAYANPASVNALRRACQALHASHSPTPELLAAARRLRLLDRGNAECVSWLATLEVQRQAEIRALVQQHARLTLEQVDALLAELSAPQLLVLPPHELLDLIKDARAKIRHRTVAEKSGGLLALLPEAYAQRDYGTVEHVVQQISKLIADADLPEEERAKMAEARAWLKDENDAFHTQLNEMEILLDDLASCKEVRSQLHVIEEFKRAIPPILRQRTMSYLEHHDVSERLRRRSLTVTVLLFLLAVGGAIAWYVLKR